MLAFFKVTDRTFQPYVLSHANGHSEILQRKMRRRMWAVMGARNNGL